MGRFTVGLLLLWLFALLASASEATKSENNDRNRDSQGEQHHWRGDRRHSSSSDDHDNDELWSWWGGRSIHRGKGRENSRDKSGADNKNDNGDNDNQIDNSKSGDDNRGGASSRRGGSRRGNSCRRVECYQDVAGNRLLRGLSAENDFTFQSAQMTVDMCARLCNGYKYVGLEFGSQCFCGNRYAYWPQRSIGCNMACAADSSRTCGGSNAIEIFDC